MNSKLISLSRVRKTRARDEKKPQADANAAKFGRTKAERVADEAREALNSRRHDGHKRDDG